MVINIGDAAKKYVENLRKKTDLKLNPRKIVEDDVHTSDWKEIKRKWDKIKRQGSYTDPIQCVECHEEFDYKIIGGKIIHCRPINKSI